MDNWGKFTPFSQQKIKINKMKMTIYKHKKMELFQFQLSFFFSKLLKENSKGPKHKAKSSNPGYFPKDPECTDAGAKASQKRA